MKKRTMHGFLGTDATLREDLNLVIQAAMGTALLCGMFLARARRFKAHQICQTSVMLLNLVMISLVMAPSFARQVKPHWRESLHDPYYATAAVHAGLGITAELLGLYIVLAAGTGLLPKWLKFKKYKPWMRTELALWTVVLLFGFGVYAVWYVVPGHHAKAARTAGLPAGGAAVTLTNFEFTPKEITIPKGTAVVWTDQTGRHKIVADDNGFQSPVLLKGESYRRVFDASGLFPYHCDFHGDKGGVDMAGVVKVTP